MRALDIFISANIIASTLGTKIIFKIKIKTYWSSGINCGTTSISEVNIPVVGFWLPSAAKNNCGRINGASFDDNVISELHAVGNRPVRTTIDVILEEVLDPLVGSAIAVCNSRIGLTLILYGKNQVVLEYHIRFPRTVCRRNI